MDLMDLTCYRGPLDGETIPATRVGTGGVFTAYIGAFNESVSVDIKGGLAMAKNLIWRVSDDCRAAGRVKYVTLNDKLTFVGWIK